MLHCSLLPPRAESKAVQVWLRRERRGERGEGDNRGGGGFWVVLLITAQEFHSKGDALVPLPRQEAHVSAVERGLEEVLLVNIVVAVTWEDLDKNETNEKSEHSYS